MDVKIFIRRAPPAKIIFVILEFHCHRYWKMSSEVISLVDSSDDEDGNGANTSSFAADRALALRLQREEETLAAQAANSYITASNDLSNRALAERLQREFAASTGLRPGVMGTLQNKRAYLHAEGNDYESSSKKHTGECIRVGNEIRDTHPRSWSSGGWVWVNDPKYNANSRARGDSDSDVRNLTREWERMVRENNVKLTHGLVLKLAKKHNVLHGKWLINIDRDYAESVWPKIRNAMVDSKLGSTAKISEEPDGKFHVVCIYCPNFLDKDELLRVRRAIINDVQISTKSILRFKLDAFTYLGIYAKNPWNMRTTTYDCGGAKDLDCTTLLSGWEKCTMIEGCPKCYPSCLKSAIPQE